MGKIFLSHSGDASRQIAEYFHAELRKVLQYVDTWISSDPACLPQGPSDYARIIQNARSCELCICFIDKNNTKSPWLLFEPGLFYGRKKNVLVMLNGGITHNQLKSRGYPLDGYHAYPDLTSIGNMLDSVNGYLQKIAKDQYETQAKNFARELKKLHDRLYGIP